MGAKKPYLTVILIQAIYAGMFLLSKAAFDMGMNTSIFVFYRQAAATFFLAPFAIFFDWKKAPSLSFITLCKFFVLSLFGITISLNLYGLALKYTSATLGAATTNSLPVLTFIIAIILRMEKVEVKTSPGLAKLAGIVFCFGGACVMALYEGPYLKLLLHHHLFPGYHPPQQEAHAHDSSNHTWMKGVFLMILGTTLWGFWLVLQKRLLKSYPSKFLFTVIQCFLSSIQSFLIAIALERDPYKWKLSLNVSLLAVAYCGIVVTGFTFYLQTWVIEKKGPVFLAMSTPIALIFTIISSAFFMGEIINLGSILGGILLVGGLYCVLWGKAKEQNIDHVGENLTSIEADQKGCSDESKEANSMKNLNPILLV